MTAPLPLDFVLSSCDSLSQVKAASSGLYWLAGIAAEDGRVTVRRRRPDGAVEDLTPEASVRSRVMEYGGGAFDVQGDVLVYVDDVSRRVWLRDDQGARALTAEQTRFRYGGLALHLASRRVLAVREDHDVQPEPRTEIVALDLDDENPDGGQVLVTGADFYAGIAVRGDRVAWCQWMHPNMSWEEASVWAAPLDDLSNALAVCAKEGVSALYPLWLDDERLAYASDESGYWNWTIAGPDGAHTYRSETDCCGPLWVCDAPALASDGGRLAFIEYLDGWGTLTLWDPAPGSIERPLSGTADVESICWYDGELHAVVSWPDRPGSLVRLTSTGDVDEVVGSPGLEEAVAPQSRWAEGPAGPVQFWAYLPEGVEQPPLLVKTHGGPTSMATASFSEEIQFWISRGFAFADINYGGSTGFGREYRERLRGQWGVLDVADVVACVEELASAGLVDRARVAIKGGSAGGYTTLQSLVSTDVFAAGMSRYGIGDLGALATDTHKAESRYTFGLVGPWPEAEEIYRERSPLFHLDRLSTPMLILQGMDDKVVPPNQAFAMADAVRAAGKPLALITFEGEGHGFRRLESRRIALEAELSFLEQIFGLPLSPDVPRLEIENL
ncbi:S9 family peptidase [Tessaracoccus caeni]|uniref:S9 family peptidase n=1 Tax=Tessaracoccus caeni TaxID=3031239 RepID=UPI0023DC7A9A|nr:prolyl oligopeptidase family serine peptidase [Tessaracoccus caeni]MDF1490317.1 prolyl oligopeptidase family serine peptidase [Tessaracoccus caeni]